MRVVERVKVKERRISGERVVDGFVVAGGLRRHWWESQQGKKAHRKKVAVIMTSAISHAGDLKKH